MESLALLAGIIVLTVLFSGPIAYIAALIRFIPQLIVSFLATVAMVAGFYWLFLPIGFMRLFGLIPIYFSFKAFRHRIDKLDGIYTIGIGLCLFQLLLILFLFNEYIFNIRP
jgi:hypothetical protein